MIIIMLKKHVPNKQIFNKHLGNQNYQKNLFYYFGKKEKRNSSYIFDSFLERK